MCTCFQGCDADIASFLLEANQWNVEAAVNQVPLFSFCLRACRGCRGGGKRGRREGGVREGAFDGGGVS